MKQPAARLTDTTAHGGVITTGAPTVRIGGLPAARLNDLHTCPMVTGVAPHLGGPIITGNTTVLIEGLAAARVGDALTCAGPPDTIAMGCETVLIGDGAAVAGGVAIGAQAAAYLAEDTEAEPCYPYILFSPRTAGFVDEDRFTLEAADGSYAETLPYADAVVDGWRAVLPFPLPPEAPRYSLRVDLASRAQEEEGSTPRTYYLFRDEVLLHYVPDEAPDDEQPFRS